MLAIIDVILPVFLVLGAGYLVAWRGGMSETAVAGLMKFAQGFALPCILFRGISQLDLAHSFSPSLVVSFYVPATVCFFVGIAGARLWAKRPWEDSIAIGFACLFSNSMLLGLPINDRAYGPESMDTVLAIVSMHAPFTYFLGITAMEIARNVGQTPLMVARKVARSIFTNNLVIGVLAGVVVNVLNIPIYHTIGEAMDLIGRAAVPAALFGLGAVLYRLRPEGDMRLILMVSAISLGLHPVLTYLFGQSFGMTGVALNTMVLTAAMAPGVNAYLFADMYGVGRRVNASSVLIATTISILSLPIWIIVMG
ncbi:AEC family transporter [Ketogulonicigenium vulgare]|uniref:Malonate transporter, putative n=1 Tax=Ketogulonicigenium vulgare (strain WSH-001) TaxID=759362 RepID=F9Y4T0_KETVW|nr:AEC family transporter [Ketogulonicigenium vulgare]ADO43537.1 auxin efflux carrier family protein [Ketogulonicigenium vulgare Y25]AEM41814.1 Malonate transporter, putative [Ketogulonicigenium vulgare WSH-001]ALJ81921.1 malonate transporter [Ketogulonicigenium vulgare]ANW34568.1 malonate transporter [Ketogulonicigenium vulgare]AOZ55572.1 auxin efflux carrier family protein [Ketogulonicigenium vulgare]